MPMENTLLLTPLEITSLIDSFLMSASVDTCLSRSGDKVHCSTKTVSRQAAIRQEVARRRVRPTRAAPTARAAATGRANDAG